MSEKKFQLRDWMNARGLTAETVASELQVEPQTVRNWKSKGVPPRRQPHVTRFMDKIDADVKSGKTDINALKEQTLVLHATKSQFRSWEKAARAAEEDHLEDWAIHALDRLAQEPGDIEDKITRLTESDATQEEKKATDVSGSTNAATFLRPPPRSKTA